MAIDKSKENTRIAKYLAMSEEDLKLLCTKGIDNPMILKQFLAEGPAAESDGESESESEETNTVFKWEYAVAAGLIDWDDAKWIEEHANDNEGQHEEPPAEPSNGNGTNA